MNEPLKNHLGKIYRRSALFFMGILLLSVTAGCATMQSPLPSGSGGETAVDVGSEGKGEGIGEKEPDKETPKIVPPKSIAMWIPKGSGAFVVDDHRMFHGIGGADGSNNPILLRASADNRSREELAKILNRFMVYATEIYWNEDGGKSSSQVGNLDVLKNTFVAVARDILSTSQISGHWQDPKNGEFYSLCQLPLSKLTGAVANDKRLDSRSKAYFLENAVRLYDQFGRESGSLTS